MEQINISFHFIFFLLHCHDTKKRFSSRGFLNFLFRKIISNFVSKQSLLLSLKKFFLFTSKKIYIKARILNVTSTIMDQGWSLFAFFVKVPLGKIFCESFYSKYVSTAVFGDCSNVLNKYLGLWRSGFGGIFQNYFKRMWYQQGWKSFSEGS